jgi:hypothetical protein
MDRQLRQRRLNDRRRSEVGQRLARAGSRLRFAKKSRLDALAVLREQFAAIVNRKSWNGVPLRAGDSIADYRGSFGALIQHGDSDEDVALVTSSLPLKNEAGEPVDLGLERGDSGFSPAAPVVELQIPEDLRDGIELEDSGLSVTPAAEGPTSGVEANEKVFYANAQTDTDVLVQPTARGFETFTQLRSANSPEDPSFEVSAPGGAELKLVPGPSGDPREQAIEISRAGRRIATVSAPRAWDADGTTVPVSYRLSGERVTMHVPHRDRDVAYPIMVDPDYVEEDWLHWANGNRDTAGWGFGYWGGCQGWFGGFGQGFYTYGLAQGGGNERWCDEGEFSEWTWTAPRNSYIYRAEYTYASHPYRYTCIIQGIWAQRSWRWDGNPRVHCGDLHNNWYTNCVDNCNPDAGDPGNKVTYLLRNQYTGWRPHGPWAELGGATLFLKDRDIPAFDNLENTSPTGWVSGGEPTVSPTAHDDGLGMWKYQLRVPGYNTMYRYHHCSSYSESQTSARCPQHWRVPDPGTNNTGFRYNIANLPEGINTLELFAHDALNKWTRTDWQVKVDRSAPSASYSGQIPAREGQTLEAGMYDIQVNATDGDGAAAQTARSGVRSIDIEVVDPATGVVRHTDSKTQDCPNGSCTMSHSFTFDSNRWGLGTHLVRVRTRDHVGREISRDFTVGIGRPADYEECLLDADTTSEPIAFDAMAYCERHNRDDDSAAPPLPADPAPVDDENVPCPAPCEPLDSDSTAVAAGVRPFYGISDGSDRNAFDDYVDTMQHPHFQALGINRWRRAVPYNVARLGDDHPYLQRFDEMYQYATTHGIELMVSFQPRVRPTESSQGVDETAWEGVGYMLDGSHRPRATGEYKNAILAFRNRWPRVRVFTAWNEPNHAYSPATNGRFRGAEQAARYTAVMRKFVCKPSKNCEVVGADIAAPRNFDRWFRNYMGYLRDETNRWGTSMPKNYGVHPYRDVADERDDLSTTKLRTFRNLVRELAPAGSDVWLTEIGSRRLDRDTYARDDADQDREVEYLVDRLARNRSEVERLYFHSFWESHPTPRWDSALTVPGGDAPDIRRPAYYEYRAVTNP